MSVLEIIAIVLAVVGVIGSILPGLPGPPLSWAGLLLVFIAGSDGRSGDPMTLRFLLIWLAVTLIVTLVDYILPAKFTSMMGGHKESSRGAIIGMIAGLIFTPIGMIMGSLLGAFLGELTVNTQGVPAALKAALGAFAGFIVTTGLKLITALMLSWYIIDFVI